MRTLTKADQQLLTPQKALDILKEGNKRFVNNIKLNRNLLQQVNETSEGQFPFAIILSCIDSRTSAELIFDQGLGDIFSVRIAGNIVNDDIIGSMEFACEIAGSKLIVVLGHKNCGAIKGACHNVKLGKLTSLLNKITPAIEEVHQLCASAENGDIVEKVATANVLIGMKSIREQSPLLNEMIESGKIGLVGAKYDVETGEVRFYENMETEYEALCSGVNMKK